MNETKKKSTIANWWTSKKTGQKVTFVLSVLAFSVSIVIIGLAMHLRDIFGDEIGDMVYGEGIQNGWVLFGKWMIGSGMSWILTFIVIAFAFVVNFLVNFLTRLFAGKGRKGKTISALIRSLTKYVVIIFALCIILAFWGVNIASILAGVGIVTLIVGLGCQTLIQDVIAGLFIVFDDYFAVGDICIIDGFRGTVEDIGLKTTKIKDAGGNIKSINNSSINTVVDLSREDSMVTVTMAAGYNEDPVRVEGILVKALPEIKKRIPQITSEIEYKGISEVGDNDISYLVLCFCKEADRFQVTRDLNRELLLLCLRENIQFVYPQIVVNQPDDPHRPATTKDEILASDKALQKNRAVAKQEEEGRFNFFHRAKESLDETTSKTFESFKDDR